MAKEFIRCELELPSRSSRFFQVADTKYSMENVAGGDFSVITLHFLVPIKRS